MHKFGTVFLLVLGLICLAERPVDAYLSPTNASMMLQLLLGGFAVFSVILKVFWSRMKDARRRSSE